MGLAKNAGENEVSSGLLECLAENRQIQVLLATTRTIEPKINPLFDFDRKLQKLIETNADRCLEKMNELAVLETKIAAEEISAQATGRMSSAMELLMSERETKLMTLKTFRLILDQKLRDFFKSSILSIVEDFSEETLAKFSLDRKTVIDLLYRNLAFYFKKFGIDDNQIFVLAAHLKVALQNHHEKLEELVDPSSDIVELRPRAPMRTLSFEESDPDDKRDAAPGTIRFAGAVDPRAQVAPLPNRTIPAPGRIPAPINLPLPPAKLPTPLPIPNLKTPAPIITHKQEVAPYITGQTLMPKMGGVPEDPNETLHRETYQRLENERKTREASSLAALAAMLESKTADLEEEPGAEPAAALNTTMIGVAPAQVDTTRAAKTEPPRALPLLTDDADEGPKTPRSVDLARVIPGKAGRAIKAGDIFITAESVAKKEAKRVAVGGPLLRIDMRRWLGKLGVKVQAPQLNPDPEPAGKPAPLVELVLPVAEIKKPTDIDKPSGDPYREPAPAPAPEKPAPLPAALFTIGGPDVKITDKDDLVGDRLTPINEQLERYEAEKERLSREKALAEKKLPWYTRSWNWVVENKRGIALAAGLAVTASGGVIVAKSFSNSNVKQVDASAISSSTPAPSVKSVEQPKLVEQKKVDEVKSVESEKKAPVAETKTSKNAARYASLIAHSESRPLQQMLASGEYTLGDLSILDSMISPFKGLANDGQKLQIQNLEKDIQVALVIYFYEKFGDDAKKAESFKDPKLRNLWKTAKHVKLGDFHKRLTPAQYEAALSFATNILERDASALGQDVSGNPPTEGNIFQANTPTSKIKIQKDSGALHVILARIDNIFEGGLSANMAKAVHEDNGIEFGKSRNGAGNTLHNGGQSLDPLGTILPNIAPLHLQDLDLGKNLNPESGFGKTAQDISLEEMESGWEEIEKSVDVDLSDLEWDSKIVIAKARESFREEGVVELQLDKGLTRAQEKAVIIDRVIERLVVLFGEQKRGTITNTVKQFGFAGFKKLEINLNGQVNVVMAPRVKAILMQSMTLAARS